MEVNDTAGGVRAEMTAFMIESQCGLTFIGDGEGRCLLLTDAAGVLALARVVQAGTREESPPLRAKHYREVLHVTPLDGGRLRVCRVDAQAFLLEDAPVQVDADLTLDAAQRTEFVRALLARVPDSVTVGARPADDLWSLA